MPAHDPCISVLQVKRLMASLDLLAAATYGVLVNLVEVRSDIVGMLKVGEETVAIRSPVPLSHPHILQPPRRRFMLRSLFESSSRFFSESLTSTPVVGYYDERRRESEAGQ